MSATKNRNGFADTEEGQEITRQLILMAKSETYNTTSTYSSNSGTYPDNLIPFVDKHINYLIKHPSIDAQQYVANIKLMTLKR